MKKIISVLFVLIILGYVLVQNGGRMFLVLLSQHRLINPFQTGSVTALSSNSTTYKNGSYIGAVADAFYGNIQVKINIQQGKIADVQFLQYPNDRMRSVAINDIAMPNLKQEAIQVQSAAVDIVTGATDTSNAFIQSLQSALNQAKS